MITSPDPSRLPRADRRRAAHILALLTRVEALLDRRARLLITHPTIAGADLTLLTELTNDLDRLLATTPAAATWLATMLAGDPAPIDQAVQVVLAAAPLAEHTRRAILADLAERGGFALTARAALAALVVNAPLMRRELAASLSALGHGRPWPREVALDTRCSLLRASGAAALAAGADDRLAEVVAMMEATGCLD